MSLPDFFAPKPMPQFPAQVEQRDPYADCICNHGRHTHVNYAGACGLCDCPYVRQAYPSSGSTDLGGS